MSSSSSPTPRAATDGGEVPPPAQCARPNCERRAADPRPAALCAVCLGTLDAEQGAQGDPKDMDLTDHYRRVADAVAPLAAYKSNPTILNADTAGWYVTRPNANPSADELGVYPEERRPQSFADDYDRAVADGPTTLYATTTYNEPRAFTEWVACRYDDERGGYAYKPRGGEGDENGPDPEAKPTPDWSETVAYGVWADLDLRDDLKAERGTGGDGWTDEHAATVADAYAAVVEEIAPLVGGPDGVFLLDSVGGGYVLTPPGVTYPIARHLAEDRDARRRVFDALNDRANAYLDRALERVHDAVDGADDVLDADVVNNVNRTFKAPLAVHARYPAVVTPLDTDDVDYGDPTLLDAVGDALLDRTREWCERFTSHDFETDDRTAALVGALWADRADAQGFDLAADPGRWRDLLDEWVAAEREREAGRERERREARERREEREARGDTLRATAAAADGEVRITTVKADVFDALDALDMERVAEDTIVHRWTDRAPGKADNSSAGYRAFVPEWRRDSNGTACIINPANGWWWDTKEDYFGGVVEAVLYAEEYPRTNPPERHATGVEWGRGLDYLRKRGYDIPVYIPDATSADATEGPDGDPKMPHWALKKVALTFGVVEDESDFARRRDAETGETYTDFDMDMTRNATLALVENAGLTHGWTQTQNRETTDSDSDSDDAETDASAEVAR